jgi:hypothetical protein
MGFWETAVGMPLRGEEKSAYGFDSKRVSKFHELANSIGAKECASEWIQRV